MFTLDAHSICVRIHSYKAFQSEQKGPNEIHHGCSIVTSVMSHPLCRTISAISHVDVFLLAKPN